LPTDCDLSLRHRGGASHSPRWRVSVIAVTATRHRGGVHFSLCTAKIIKGSDLHNGSIDKYRIFTLFGVLTSAFSCCNFAEEMSAKALLSSLVRTRNIPGYSFFRDIANARHRQTSLSLLSLNRDVVKRME